MIVSDFKSKFADSSCKKNFKKILKKSKGFKEHKDIPFSLKDPVSRVLFESFFHELVLPFLF